MLTETNMRPMHMGLNVLLDNTDRSSKHIVMYDKHERPLGQWKTPPANKLPFVTSRLKWYYYSWLIYLFHADLLPLKV